MRTRTRQRCRRWGIGLSSLADDRSGARRFGGAASADAAPSSSAPGVHAPPRSRSGTISSLTGTIAADFDAFVPGMQAYFDMVNANGRGQRTETRPGATPSTTGATRPRSPNWPTPSCSRTMPSPSGSSTNHGSRPICSSRPKIPTYGYNVIGNWAGPPQPVFAADGSIQNYVVGRQPDAYLIKQTKSKSVAIVSYGPAITASYDSCHTVGQTLAPRPGSRWGTTTWTPTQPAATRRPCGRCNRRAPTSCLNCMQGSDDITAGPEHPAVRPQGPPAVAQRLRPPHCCSSTRA